MPKAIVVVADQKLLPVACCVHLSCLECGELDGEVTLFLITDSISGGELYKAKSFFGGRSRNVKILASRPGLSEKYKASRHLTAASYLRLHLDELLGQKWDRVLYLDADTRVMASLQPLLSANLQGQPLMAGHDFFGLYQKAQLEDCRSRLSLKHNAPYFNSGVLLFDWPRVLAGGFLARARQYAQEHADLVFGDQDALNVAFEGHWTPFELLWNCNPRWLPAHVTPLIAHFFGGAKPWQQAELKRQEIRSWRSHNRWFQETLSKSPWPDFVCTEKPGWLTPRVQVRALFLKLCVAAFGVRRVMAIWRKVYPSSYPKLYRFVRKWRKEIGVTKTTRFANQLIGEQKRSVEVFNTGEDIDQPKTAAKPR